MKASAQGAIIRLFMQTPPPSDHVEIRDRGASDVRAHVIVSLTAPSSPVLLAEFDLESANGKKPGAAATMGVGSVATSVRTSAATDSKASVEGDTTRMAKMVATEIEDIMVVQQWIPPMKTSKQSETAQASQQHSDARTWYVTFLYKLPLKGSTLLCRQVLTPQMHKKA